MDFSINEAQLKEILFDIRSDASEEYWAMENIKKAVDPSNDALLLTRANARNYGRLQILAYFGLHINITDATVEAIDNKTDEVVLFVLR